MATNTTSVWVLVFNMSLWANDWEMGREGKERKSKGRKGKGRETGQVKRIQMLT